ncbi:uncharacterized protein LOC116010078 [Ipomoea triloba]|uniref:uncharacterized protein LOC116010078 n=1 Tax=Ipomoea triloba TaxID=35885 RepID=UPI00125D2274|nr:uncharacterized protein LOC116010078 [Ipomoea triloba]
MGMYCLANQLKAWNRRSAIKLRVMRTYCVMERRGSTQIKSRELIFHDEEGTVMHAHIPNDILPKFLNSFVEGSVYCVKNFFVVANWHTYKTSMHEYMLQFNGETIMKEYRSANFPRHMYRIRSFQSLRSNPSINDKELFDLIGRVVQIHAPQQKTINGNDTRLIDFVIEDSQGNRLTCTFWDDHVAKIEPFYQSPGNEPLYVLIQCCRLKFCVRDGDVKICSSYDVTQIHFNIDCPEMQQFKESMTELSQLTPMRSIASMSSMSFTNTHDDSSTQSLELITINDLYDTEDFGDFWIAARVNGVEKPSDWFYISCLKKGCNKALKLSEGVNKCFKCNEIPDGSVRKYKLRVRVVDMKGTASFLIWDRECVDLLGIAAEDLYERNLNNLGHIKEIYELKGRTMLFKISAYELKGRTMLFKISAKKEHFVTMLFKISAKKEHFVRRIFKISAKKEHFVRRNIPFPVVKINTDQLLLQQLCPDLLALEENDFKSEGPISEGDDKFLEGFESDEGESPVALLAPTSSTDCTTDGPVKRCLLDSFSSTKGGKKVKQCHVKLEKID